MNRPAKPRTKADIRDAMKRLMEAARERVPHVDLPMTDPGRETSAPTSASPTLPPGPAQSEPKVPISIRLDADLVAALRASGRGWQSRVNAILRDAVEIGSAPGEELSGDPQ